MATDGSLGYDSTGTDNLEGREFDEAFVQGALPVGCDLLGEQGEFHTHVVF